MATVNSLIRGTGHRVPKNRGVSLQKLRRKASRGHGRRNVSLSKLTRRA